MRYQGFFVGLLILTGCAAMSQDASQKKASLGIITTPASYYSTPKGRYLGGKYNENLDRLVEKIVRNGKTANLQFANNIAGLGGIGFFTHAAAKSPDERYLEVIVGTPDTFEATGDVSAKVSQLFTNYGSELLSILVSDVNIFLEKEVSGYGINFSWRTVGQNPATARVVLERAVIYFPKEKVKSFLQQEISRNALLAESTMFGAMEDGPMNLVSFRPQLAKSDSRPPILEENLAGGVKAGSIPAIAQPAVPQHDSPAAEKKSPDGGPQPAPVPATTRALTTMPPQQLQSSTVPKGAAQNAPMPTARAPQAAPTGATGEKNIELTRVPETTDRAGAKETTAARLEVTPKQQTAGAIRAQGPAAIAPVVTPPAAAPPIVQSKESDGAAKEQIALLRSKPREPLPPKTSATRLPPKTLEGFIIQIAFSDRSAAQRWAETLERRGYAVSVTEAGGSDTIRLRVGNFPVRDAAERQLRQLRQEGLGGGIVIHLPQGYKPELSSRALEKSENSAAVSR